MKVYLEINDKCKTIASELGDGWTVRRVGRALWTAAIVSAYSDEIDLTLPSDSGEENVEPCNDEIAEDVVKEVRKKRRRTS